MEHKQDDLSKSNYKDITGTPAERILEAIKIMNTSGYQVQKDLGMSMGAVSNWRRGLCQPSEKMIDAFCDKYRFSRNWIITGIGNMRNSRKTYATSVQDQLRDLRQRVESLEQEVVQLKKKKTPKSIPGGI